MVTLDVVGACSQLCAMVYGIGVTSRPQRRAAIVAVVPLTDAGLAAARKALNMSSEQKVPIRHASLDDTRPSPVCARPGV